MVSALRSPNVVAQRRLVALLVVVAAAALSGGLAILLLRRWQQQQHRQNPTTLPRHLSLIWDANTNTTTTASSSTVSLEPRYFDLETTTIVTLRRTTRQPGEEEEDVISFHRTASSARIVGNRRMVTWEGAAAAVRTSNGDGVVAEYDATQIATLLHDATVTLDDDSGRGTTAAKAVQALTGSLATKEASFTVTTVSTGDIQIERTPWDMFPSSSSSSADNDGADLVVDLGLDGTTTEEEEDGWTNWTAGIIHRGGPVYAPLPERRRRHRRLDDEEDGTLHTIDLLVIVTRRATCEFNREDVDDCDITEETTEPMDRRLALSVAQTNSAFEFGDVNARLRLVEVVYLESDFDGRAGIETLQAMSRSRDVVEYRNDAGADLVMMVTGRHPTNCGIALLNTPLSAVGYDCFGAYTFSHEIGHNFGANHDRPSTPDNQFHDYGHGFALEDEFHTIMAYGCEDEDGSLRRCPMAPYFSANDQELPDGRPLGDEDHDNVRIMNDNAARMADWRDTVVEDDGSNNTPETTTTPEDTIIEDHEVDCPESRRCGDEQASLRKESDDGDCEELCVCRENCAATEVALWVAFTFAGFECGEC